MTGGMKHDAGKPRTIYVAGGSSERAQIAGYMARLRAAGWVVTYDWTADPGWSDPMHPRDTSARNDVRGIETAAVFWLVCPETKSEGAHFELGYACALFGPGRSILVSGPHTALGRVFPSIAGRRYQTHAEALAVLTRKERTDLDDRPVSEKP